MKKKSELYKRIDSVTDVIILIGVPVLMLVLWELLSRGGVIPSSSMPAPTSIAERFVKMVQDGSLQIDILVSLGRISKGFFLGAVAGIFLGIIISLVKKIDRATVVIVSILRPIPIIALLPLFILWFGIDENSKTAVIALGTFWPVLLNTIQGIKQADQKLIEVAQVLKLPYWQIIVKIIVPSAFPFIFTGIRLGIGMALACVVTAEMVAASEGLGYMIMYARMMSQPDVLMVGVFVLGFFGLLIEVGMLELQKHLFKY